MEVIKKKIQRSNQKSKSNSNSKSKSKILLRHRRKPKLSIEEILEIYCKKNHIKDEEITQKITSIHYEDPESNLIIDYKKERGQKFPLPGYLASKNKNLFGGNNNYSENEFQYKIQNEIENVNNQNEKKNEQPKFYEENDLFNDDNYGERIIFDDEEHKKDDKNIQKYCFICEWVFLPEMTVQERNTHINMCMMGKGEENKRETIETYNQLEVFKILERKQKQNHEISQPPNDKKNK